MKDTCFYTVYDDRAKEMAQGMVRSVKKFYPDIPFKECTIPLELEFNLQTFCHYCLEFGQKLLEEYKRVIYLDPDHIMCAPCPDLFGDFDLGVVANNIPVASAHGGIDGTLYVNNGMVVCTNKKAWQDYYDEYNKRCSEGFEALHHQNALNYLVHLLKYNTKLLEFDDRAYGVSCNFDYHRMYVKDDQLFIPIHRADRDYDKKLCLFHGAGPEWKNNGTSLKLDDVRIDEAREKLRSYTL